MIKKKFSDLRKEVIHNPVEYYESPAETKLEDTTSSKKVNKKIIQRADFEKVFGKAPAQPKPPQIIQDISQDIIEEIPEIVSPPLPVSSLNTPELNIPSSDALVNAIENLPNKIVDLMKHLPTPVISPRPPGAWVIDVERDTAGTLSRMIAQFHETTE